MKHVLALLAASVAFSVGAQPSASSATGNLNLTGVVVMVSADAPCPAGTPQSAVCHARTAQGGISGLGEVTQTYMYSGDFGPCPTGEVKILGYTTSFRVAGKGEIHFSVADAPACLTAEPAGLAATQSFTVTGGTGIYAGISGSGRIERAASRTAGGAAGVDRWIGTLVAPGLEFDVTPPTMAGAASKTVRAPKSAKQVRVTYRVTASDAVDGGVAVKCFPGSGSRFAIGRTAVRCSATDTSANTATARFVVTVKTRR